MESVQQTGLMTIRDYDRLPEGAPYQLIRGSFVMSPSPTFKHQTCISNLYSFLREWVRAGRRGIVTLPPFDVVLDNENVVQPDITFVRIERRHIIRQRCEGVPDLVVEVLSSKPSLDRKDKLELYSSFKVPHYWILDPVGCTLECLTHDGSKYRIDDVFAREEVAKPAGFEGLEIPLAELWKDDLGE